MKLLAVAFIFVLVAGLVSTADEEDKLQVPLVRVRRSHGCPFRTYQCDGHCLGRRRRGGYCGGFLYTTCICKS
uniref:Putative tick defensins 1 n=1 Tax=Amblyomma cajennense TaxID=34607 RepID=A0A023FSE6_AMBCJ